MAQERFEDSSDEKSAYDYVIKGKPVPPEVERKTLERLEKSGLLKRKPPNEKEHYPKSITAMSPVVGPWCK
jgi:hypothetical protein